MNQYKHKGLATEIKGRLIWHGICQAPQTPHILVQTEQIRNGIQPQTPHTTLQVCGFCFSGQKAPWNWR